MGGSTSSSAGFSHTPWHQYQVISEPHLTVCFSQRLFNSNNFVVLTALEEVCALPSAL